MLFSIVVCSTCTSSRNGMSGAVPVAPGSGSAFASPERTRSASNSSGVVRAERGSSSMIFTSSFSRGRWSRSTDSPPTAMRSVCEIVSALMPCSAAFSLSMTKRAFGWSASIYQSTSTTPGVLLKMSRTLRGERVAVVFVGPVDFGDERLQHRRAGRHFGDGDARTVSRGDRGDARAHAFGDVVALRVALAFRNQIDLHVRHVRALRA